MLNVNTNLRQVSFYNITYLTPESFELFYDQVSFYNYKFFRQNFKQIMNFYSILQKFHFDYSAEIRICVDSRDNNFLALSVFRISTRRKVFLRFRKSGSGFQFENRQNIAAGNSCLTRFRTNYILPLGLCNAGTTNPSKIGIS